MIPPPLILASQSPRRIDLLREAGVSFEVHPADVDERMDAALGPPELTCANAELKALHVLAKFPSRLVLGADTLVYFEGQPLGKPGDLDEAFRMLSRLQGQTHQVCTGVAILGDEPATRRVFHEVTDVTFKPLTADEIRGYLGRINPLDKAGGYAAQDHGDTIIARTVGSWTNVVGLPMEKVSAALTELGLVSSA